MASLQEIKQRIGSISTIMKITNAMKLVATSKLKKSQADVARISQYNDVVSKIFTRLTSKISSEDKVFPLEVASATLYIVVTSDYGLCGSYNNSAYDLVEENIKNGDYLVALGTKGSGYFSMSSISNFKAFPNIGDKPNYESSTEVAKDCFIKLSLGQVQGVKLIYTNYLNSVTTNVVIEQIFPTDNFSDETEKVENKQGPIMEFEPSALEIVREFLPFYLSSVIYGRMAISKVSEMIARRLAMENATDNADDIIQELKLNYNRARQSTITQEINEIVSGSNIS